MRRWAMTAMLAAIGLAAVGCGDKKKDAGSGGSESAKPPATVDKDGGQKPSGGADAPTTPAAGTTREQITRALDDADAKVKQLADLAAAGNNAAVATQAANFSEGLKAIRGQLSGWDDMSEMARGALLIAVENFQNGAQGAIDGLSQPQ
ncbi:MAG: hypothetical protein BIFFINMI_01983 [Phycisphaerae bacterium]|nr:hypothetical protein [Phycisphaerae bacterium]